MDGNGRWAEGKGLSRQQGHEVGSSKVYDIYNLCINLGCKSATFFAMSSENMQRDGKETEFISELLKSSILKHFSDLQNNKIKFKVIGDTSKLPKELKDIIKDAEYSTRHFDLYKMYIAYNYGGQWDILNSIKSAIANNEPLTHSTVQRYLSTENDFPDLIVRTGGYKRLSNFMLWQAGYSELKFLDVLWQDISENDIKNIFQEYKNTKRNFGKVDK